MKNISERFIGVRFGKLVVVSFDNRNLRGQTFWKCKCDCGKEKVVRGDHLLNTATKSCGCNNQGARHHKWKGCGEIGGWTWNNYRIGAKRRKIPFKVTIEEMWNKFLTQDRKCALSGVELFFSPIQGSGPKTNASMDRIDPLKGYTVDNVQWVTKDVNFAKRILTQTQFLELCKRVTETNTGPSINGRSVHSH